MSVKNFGAIHGSGHWQMTHVDEKPDFTQPVPKTLQNSKCSGRNFHSHSMPNFGTSPLTFFIFHYQKGQNFF
jgi:hypothetical protein